MMVAGVALASGLLVGSGGFTFKPRISNAWLELRVSSGVPALHPMRGHPFGPQDAVNGLACRTE